MQTKDVFPRGTRNVPQIPFSNVDKLNRVRVIRVSLIVLDLKYRLCSIIAKPHSNSAAIRLFYPNISNGLWYIATVAMQRQNPEY